MSMYAQIFTAAVHLNVVATKTAHLQPIATIRPPEITSVRSTEEGRRIGNHLLLSIPQAEFSLLKPLANATRLIAGTCVQEPGETISNLYFPNNGLVSLVVTMKDGKRVEVGSVGRDGALGSNAVFGAALVPYRAILFGGGDGITVSLSALHPLLPELPNFQWLLAQQSLKQGLQAQQLAACNRLHSVEQRLARWLLTMHDRMDDEVLKATHDYLAAMLGTDRPSISIAAGVLQRRGAILYSRGLVKVVSRPNLEECACECFAVLQTLQASESH